MIRTYEISCVYRAIIKTENIPLSLLTSLLLLTLFCFFFFFQVLLISTTRKNFYVIKIFIHLSYHKYKAAAA